MQWRYVYFLIPLAFAHGDEFREQVYPLFEKAGCAGCHHADGVASATRLQFPEKEATPAEIEAFGRSLRNLADPADPAKSLLVSKPTRRVAHAGGKRIEPGSAEEKTLLTWIAELAKQPETGETATTHASAKPVGPLMRRLTHAQYNNTVRDLLGDESRIADSFPPEDFVNGFRNQYQAQNTSPLLAEAYSVAAEKLAKKAISGNPNLIPCKPTSASDAACRKKFVASFGRKAFRRPLSTDELARYTKLFANEAALKEDFRAGAQIVIEAMLQAPNFLLRAENGLESAMRPYETASRLSYFVWNSMPDEKLLRAAESGELDTPEGVEKHVRRMLSDKRARASMDEFLTEWLRFDRLLGTVKDRRSFPQYSLELAVAMTEETRRLFGHLIWNNQNFMDFYSAGYTFLSTDLANLYKVPPPKTEYAQTPLPPETARAGILGQATFLALTSKPADTSPTARGLFVREQFLCQEVPQPPPGVASNLPPLAKEKPQTNRERLAVHLSNESCASCHNLIDPIGFGMEKFDAIGQYREKVKLRFAPGRKEKGEVTTVELPLDTSGSVAGLRDSSFSSPRELGKILAGSEQCQQCVVKQLFRYAAGRKDGLADRAVISKAFEDFRRSEFRFQELIVSLAKWSVFAPGS